MSSKEQAFIRYKDGRVRYRDQNGTEHSGGRTLLPASAVGIDPQGGRAVGDSQQKLRADKERDKERKRTNETVRATREEIEELERKEGLEKAKLGRGHEPSTNDSGSKRDGKLSYS
jgi:hypothetical protein